MDAPAFLLKPHENWCRAKSNRHQMDAKESEELRMRRCFCPPPRGRVPGPGVGGLIQLVGRHRGAEPRVGAWPSLGTPRPGQTCTSGQGPNPAAVRVRQARWCGRLRTRGPDAQFAWPMLTHARGPNQGLRASLLVSAHSGLKDQPFVLCSRLAGDPSLTFLPLASPSFWARLPLLLIPHSASSFGRISSVGSI